MGRGGGNTHSGAAGSGGGPCDGRSGPRRSPNAASAVSRLFAAAASPSSIVGAGGGSSDSAGGEGGDMSNDGADVRHEQRQNLDTGARIGSSHGGDGTTAQAANPQQQQQQQQASSSSSSAAASRGSSSSQTHRGTKRRRSEASSCASASAPAPTAADTTSISNDSNSTELFGYVMLDDCTVTVFNDNNDTDVVLGKWMELNIDGPSSCQTLQEKGFDTSYAAAATAATASQEGKKNDQYTVSSNEVEEGPCCRRCNIVLRADSAASDTAPGTCSQSVSIDPSSIVRFDGTCGDMKSIASPLNSTSDECSKSSSSASSAVTSKIAACAPRCTAGAGNNRSDASLLLGLVLQCQDLGLVAIRKAASIILYGKVGNNCIDEQKPVQFPVDGCCSSKGEVDEYHCSAVTPYRAGIVITVSVLREVLVLDEDNSKPPTKRARRSFFSQGRSRLLPPSMQLLLSLLRCDWSRLELSKQRLVDRLAKAGDETNVEQMRKASLFPPDMSLGELYKRIRGARSHTAAAEEGTNREVMDVDDDGSYRPFCNTNLLPDVIIVSHIAPFLRARSLYSLRCSSSRLYDLLRAVVPGLKLRLFKHQINSLDWMRNREIMGLTEADFLHHQRTGTIIGAEDDLIGGDFHRAASGGASTLLSCSHGADPDKNAIDISMIRVEGRTGKAVKSNTSHVGRLRRFARGGLLCDDPGLGKTITVLSLVLQTFGQSTERPRLASNSNSFSSDDKVFLSYWREGLTSVGRTPELLRLVNQLRQADPDSVYFELPIDPIKDSADKYLDIIKTPICIRDILSKINVHGYGDDFERLCSDINLCFRNAMLYNPPEHDVHKAAKRLSQKFTELVAQFKSEKTKSARKAYSSISAKPDSSVAAILAERANDELLDSLYPSSGTLLVVPNPLLKHWEEQISMHVNSDYCTNKIPLIFRHCRKNKSSCTTEEATGLCSVHQTHFPLLFIDEGNTPLPPPEFLAMFRIVLTTNQRIAQEWKKGSVEEELNINRTSIRGNGRQASYRIFFDDVRDDLPPPSPLLKVHWLRLVVDEGHTMGRGTNSNTVQFASWINARSRWCMTGTPTQQTVSQTGLRNILGLVKFLKHDFFSAKLGGDAVWNDLIAKSWKEGDLTAFYRLQMLLSLLMVRHTKEDIEEIPPPLYVRTYSTMSRRELTSYNTLVSAAQMNIKTTSMKGKTSGWQDSLLNPRESKHAREVLRNIRIACCGGAQMLPTLEGDLWIETIQYLRMRHNLDDVRVRVVDNYLQRATTGELSSCFKCGLQLQTLFIVPCGCLVCTECIDSNIDVCSACKQTFDFDQFQELQPGLVYKWTLNKWSEDKERESAAALRRQLNEDQARNGTVNDGSEVVPAVAAAVPPGGGEETNREGEPMNLVGHNNNSRNRAGRQRTKDHQCTFSRSNADGKCLRCREEHFDCNFLLNRGQCSICFKNAEDCPQHASKALLVTNKLLALREAELAGNRSVEVSHAASRLLGESTVATRRPLKTIIFSQFRILLDYVGDRLIRRFGGSCVAEFWGSTRSKELEKFKKSSSCFCMLLGTEGSHGLDLSFVTNIIILDELYDKSLEEQVVARAYRMGATGRVEVEQLVARDSVEELMEEMNNRESSKSAKAYDDIQSVNDDANKQEDSQGSRKKKATHAKLHYLLKNVRLARTGSRESVEGERGLIPLPAAERQNPRAAVRFGEPTVHEIL